MEPDEGIADESQIDPESIKNVDGQPRQRKGSSRFTKKQRDNSKSPHRGNRNSVAEEDHGDAEEMNNCSDLSSRLEETNKRMKKLSDVFNACEESFSDSEQTHHNNPCEEIERKNDIHDSIKDK